MGTDAFTMDFQLLIFATCLFAGAVVHTLIASRFHQLGNRFRRGSILENLFHYLGEVETVFGLWSIAFLVALAVSTSADNAVRYIESLNFTEAMFVFAVMCVSATKPVLDLATWILDLPTRFAGRRSGIVSYVTLLTVGPLLGSFITEPAAMTLCALLLRDRFFTADQSDRLKYATLGLLFVNISVGGTLTNYAAPPVLMVAGRWGWDATFMMTMFGWKAALGVALGTAITAIVFRKELNRVRVARHKGPPASPWWVIGVHVAFLASIVVWHQRPAFFLPMFLMFLGWTDVSREHQSPLRIRESLLVGLFLGGLVVLGSPQGWWITWLLGRMSEITLFLGATALTAVTDNAALTYLGTLVEGLSDSAKYLLVAGAVTGGGLTVIANAPNPAGYGILKGSFGKNGISAAKLFVGAIGPTALLAALFWLL